MAVPIKAIQEVELIEKHKDTLRQLREKYHVKSLYLFGSAARGEDREGSDLDFLVDFKEEEIALLQSWRNYLNFKRSLEDLFKRDVDLVQEQALKNPYVLMTINMDKQPIYG